eukprot:gene6681-10846_t
MFEETSSTTENFSSKQKKPELTGFAETLIFIAKNFFTNLGRQEYTIGIILHIILLLSYSFFLSILIQDTYQLGSEVKTITFVLGAFLYVTSFVSLLSHFYSINTTINNNREYLKIMIVVNFIFSIVCLFIQFCICLLWLKNGKKKFFTETLISLTIVELGHVAFSLIIRKILITNSTMSHVPLKPKSETLFDSFIIPSNENQKKE